MNNLTYVSNFTTNLSCTLVDNVNQCTGNIAVVPYNQDVIVVLLIIITICLIGLLILTLIGMIFR